MNKIKRNDEVVVTTGKDKNKRGKVLRIVDGKRVLVSGINMVKKHTRPNPMMEPRVALLKKKPRFIFLTWRSITRRTRGLTESAFRCRMTAPRCGFTGPRKK